MGETGLSIWGMTETSGSRLPFGQVRLLGRGSMFSVILSPHSLKPFCPLRQSCFCSRSLSMKLPSMGNIVVRTRP